MKYCKDSNQQGKKFIRKQEAEIYINFELGIMLNSGFGRLGEWRTARM